jgi:hypothetical protein
LDSDTQACDGSHGLAERSAENGHRANAAGPPRAVLTIETQWPRPATVEGQTLKRLA